MLVFMTEKLWRAQVGLVSSYSTTLLRVMQTRVYCDRLRYEGDCGSVALGCARSRAQQYVNVGVVQICSDDCACDVADCVGVIHVELMRSRPTHAFMMYSVHTLRAHARYYVVACDACAQSVLCVVLDSGDAVVARGGGARRPHRRCQRMPSRRVAVRIRQQHNHHQPHCHR